MQGFPMMQGVLCAERVRLLLKKGSKCYRQRRTGEMKRKSVRGCIVSHDLSVLNLVIVKRGETPIPGGPLSVLFVTVVDDLGDRFADSILPLFFFFVSDV